MTLSTIFPIITLQSGFDPNIDELKSRLQSLQNEVSLFLPSSSRFLSSITHPLLFSLFTVATNESPETEREEVQHEISHDQIL
jgi:hypothetical protein